MFYEHQLNSILKSNRGTEMTMDERILILEKRIQELEYRTANPSPDELKDILKLMKEFGVQRLSHMGMNIEMPYQHLRGDEVPIRL